MNQVTYLVLVNPGKAERVRAHLDEHPSRLVFRKCLLAIFMSTNIILVCGHVYIFMCAVLYVLK